MNTYFFKQRVFVNTLQFILTMLCCFFLQNSFGKWIINTDPTNNQQGGNTNQQYLDASVDRTKAAYGERLKLKLSVNYDTDSAINIDKLKKDFTIIGMQKSKQVRIVNGKSDASTEWLVTILPHNTGSIEIPQIYVDNLSSDPIYVLITDRATSQKTATKSQEPVFVTAEISNKNVFVQQETILTARIYYRIQLLGEKHLTPLKIDGALIQKLGDSISFTTTIDGQTYQVDQLRFAIYPQQSGILTIPSLIFDGAVAIQQDPFGIGNFGNFNNFLNQGEPFSIPTVPVELKVNDKIPDYPDDQPWLPAKNFSLTQNWKRVIQNIPTGEQITQIITVQAEGLSSAQIPNIDIPQIDGVNIYADQPVTTDHPTEKGLVGEKKLTITYIPIKPGNYKIPEINYTWFDLTNRQTKIATIPQLELNALGTGINKEQKFDNEQNTTSQLPKMQTNQDTEITNENATQNIVENNNNIWKWSTIIMSCLWLLFIICWLYKKIILPKKDKIIQSLTKTFSRKNNETIAFDKLVNACESQNLKEVTRYLEKWCEVFLNLDKTYSATDCIHKLNSDTVSNFYTQLNLHIYGRKEFTLNLQDLILECKNIRKTFKDKPEKEENIADIYPNIS